MLLPIDVNKSSREEEWRSRDRTQRTVKGSKELEEEARQKQVVPEAQTMLLDPE